MSDGLHDALRGTVWALGLLAAVGFDTAHRRLPNPLLLALALAALVLALMPAGMGLQMALRGGVVALLFFLPGYVLHRLGAGDVKLAAVCGLLAGGDAVWGLCLAIAVVGGAQALLWQGALWWQRWRTAPLLGWPQHNGALTAATRMPYAWAVAGGSLLQGLGWPF